MDNQTKRAVNPQKYHEISDMLQLILPYMLLVCYIMLNKLLIWERICIIFAGEDITIEDSNAGRNLSIQIEKFTTL